MQRLLSDYFSPQNNSQELHQRLICSLVFGAVKVALRTCVAIFLMQERMASKE